jgi:hypothetical protein
MGDRWPPARLALGLPVALILLVGLGAGLARLGWQMDPLSQRASNLHGALMVSGFMGTLILLERAVALVAIAPRYRWSFAVPVVNGAGALLLLFGGDSLLARGLLLAGSAGMLLLFGVMLRRHAVTFVKVMAVGALAWVVGNALWAAGRPVYVAVHWWMAFLVLTVVGERLELARILRLSRAGQIMLLAAVGVYAGGVLLTVAALDAGVRVSGLGLILMALWLLRYDIARHTVRGRGLPRYAAMCLLAGYGWLAVGGLLGLWNGAVYAGPLYEALLHAILLGFIFTHMPIIAPALTGRPIAFHPIVYGHFVLLQVGLVYRLYGDLAGDFTARQWGGMLNVIALLLFLVVTIGLLRRGAKETA